MELQDIKLPANWRGCVLREACLKTSLWSPERERRESFTYVDVSAVSNERFCITEPQVVHGANAPSRARKIIKAGDVIYATVRPSLKRVAWIEPSFDEQIASTAFCVVRANPKQAESKFLYYSLLTDEVNRKIVEHEHGASYPAITDKDVLNQFILLPPLTEQRKIAAVLWKVQEAVQTEAAFVRNARALKKSLLRSLFMYGLRDQPRKETPYGEVPENWDIQLLSECAHVQTGVAKGRLIDSSEVIEVPYLRVANVQAGHLDLSEIKNIQIRRDELVRYSLRKDDVVLTEGGDFDKLGRGFIWDGQIEPCVHQNHIFAVRPRRDRLSPNYFAYLIQSSYGRGYFLAVAHKTTNLACINTNKLKAFPVLIPPLADQEKIAGILQTVDAKIAVHEAKQRALQDLFKTLLHQLMTAQLRVNHLDIDTSEVGE